jgi:hypothetical protein
VHWAGWETDTFRLQKAGWKISAEQDIMSNSMYLAMAHDGLGMRAISDRLVFNYHMAADGYRGMEYVRDFVIQMRHVGRDIHVQTHGPMSFSFQPIDAMPTFTENRITKLEDLAHFAAPLVKTREIIIPQDSVPELLERILKLQQPARTDRIREQVRNPEGSTWEAQPQQRMEAQIISMVA